MHQRLIDFISHARQKGMDHAAIRVLLLSTGWKDRDIARAMAEQGLDLAVPEPAGSGVGGPRDTFLYLLTFTALYIAAVSVVLLFFEYFNLLFPDPAQPEWTYSESHSRSTIRWSLASVIVAFPLFVALERRLLHELRLKPERAKSGIRRWLTYLTLFVAAVTAVFNLITLVDYFLEGELSTRFVLKVLVLFIVTGAVFVYYLMSLRFTGETS